MLPRDTLCVCLGCISCLVCTPAISVAMPSARPSGTATRGCTKRMSGAGNSKRCKAAPAGASLVGIVRLLCGEEVQALLVEGSAQQRGLSGHSSAALCGCQLALGLDALLGNALIKSHSQEALRVLHLAQDARHPVCHQIHHLQPPCSSVLTS